MSAEALIDLGGGEPPRDPRPAPPQRYRTTGVLVGLLLVAVLGGAAPSAGPPWQSLGRAAVTRSDADYLVAGDRLYVDSAGRRRTVTAYAVRPWRTLWRVHLPAADGEHAELAPVRDRLLVRVDHSSRGPSTTALDALTGAVRWSVPHGVEPLPDGRTGLVQEEVFRGAAYDPSSGAPGPIFLADSGIAYGRPPQRTIVHGVDLADGRDRWTVQRPGSVFAAPARGRPGGVVVVAVERARPAGRTLRPRLQLLDAGTGVVRRESVLPELPDGIVSDGAAVTASTEGDLLVIAHHEDGGLVRTAYGLADLAPRWRLPARSSDELPRFCAGVPCAQTPDGLALLEPGSGAPRWTTPAGTDLVERGGHAVELDTSGATPVPVRTVDLATGAPRVALAGWPVPVTGAPRTPLLLAAPDHAGTAFAVLAPGERDVRPLGRGDTAVADCRADAALVACRDAAGIQVWSYHL